MACKYCISSLGRLKFLLVAFCPKSHDRRSQSRLVNLISSSNGGNKCRWPVFCFWQIRMSLFGVHLFICESRIPIMLVVSMSELGRLHSQLPPPKLYFSKAYLFDVSVTQKVIQMKRQAPEKYWEPFNDFIVYVFERPTSSRKHDSEFLVFRDSMISQSEQFQIYFLLTSQYSVTTWSRRLLLT